MVVRVEWGHGIDIHPLINFQGKNVLKLSICVSGPAEWRIRALEIVTAMIKRKTMATLCKLWLQATPFPDVTAEGKAWDCLPWECLDNQVPAIGLGPRAATLQSKALLAEWRERKNKCY